MTQSADASQAKEECDSSAENLLSLARLASKVHFLTIRLLRKQEAQELGIRHPSAGALPDDD